MDAAKPRDRRGWRRSAIGSPAARRRECATTAAPDVWFTYHVHHKAPDLLGPAVSRALGIPYVDRGGVDCAEAARRPLGGRSCARTATPFAPPI